MEQKQKTLCIKQTKKSGNEKEKKNSCADGQEVFFYFCFFEGEIPPPSAPSAHRLSPKIKIKTTGVGKKVFSSHKQKNVFFRNKNENIFF